jgi:hypothetical protein
MTVFKKDTHVQFNAQRIYKGNPVKGIVVSEDEEWVTIKLDHDLEGQANVWHEGEEKKFRKSFLSDIKIL